MKHHIFTASGKILLGLFLVALLLTAGNIDARAQTEVQVLVDGKTLESDVPAQIVQDRVMLPLRSVAESLGAVVSFDAGTRVVTVLSPDRLTIKFPLHPNWYGANSPSVLLRSTSAPVIINNRTLVSLRFLAEHLGATVDWDASARTALVSTGQFFSTPQAGIRQIEYELAPTAEGTIQAAFSYPESWRLVKDFTGSSHFLLQAPSDPGADAFTENLMLSIGTTPTEFKNLTAAEALARQLKILESYVPGFRDAESSILSETPSQSALISFYGTVDDLLLYHQFGTCNGFGYSIDGLFTGDEKGSQLTQYQTTGSQILRSLKIWLVPKASPTQP